MSRGGAAASWDVAGLRAAAGQWAAAGSVISGEGRRTGELADLDPEVIGGAAGEAFADRLRSSAGRLGADGMLLTTIADVLGDAASAMAPHTVHAGGDDPDLRRTAQDRLYALDAEYASRLLTFAPTGHAMATAPADWVDVGPDIAGLAPGDRLGSGTVLSAGDGTTLVANGDPATAEQIVLFVPGTGSTVLEPETQTQRAETLREELRARGTDAAVVTFFHDAPPWLLPAGGSTYYPPAAARLQAAAAQVSGLNPAAHLTVMGYSHGGIITGYAAAAAHGPGLRADSLMLLGSTALGPGVGHVRDLRLLDSSGKPHPPAGHGDRVLAATAKDDPIRLAPGLTGRGRGPHDPRMGARQVPLPGWEDNEQPRSVLTAHSSYFWDPVSLGNIAGAIAEVRRR